MVRQEVEMSLSKAAVKVLPSSLVNIWPRVTTKWFIASTVEKGKLGGIDDSVGMTDTGTILVILPLFAEASTNPVMDEPAEFVAVTGLIVLRRYVVKDPNVFCPTDPT